MLSDEQMAVLQGILDTPLEKEDAAWQEIVASFKGSNGVDEESLRRGIRLLASVAKKSGKDILTQTLQGLGIVAEFPAAGPPAPGSPTLSKKPAKKSDSPLSLPDEVVGLMKEAGVEEFAEILKGLEASPDVSRVITPLIAVMCARLKKQDEQLAKSAEREQTAEISKVIDGLGLGGDTAALVSAFKSMDSGQRDSVLKALQPGLERMRKADELLLMESGTEKRGDGAQTALQKAEKLALEMVSKGDAKDKDAAIEEVWKLHPQLYNQHRAESYSARGGGA